MRPRLYLYAAAAWLPLAVLAVLNGLLRNYTYGPLVGEQLAHLLSSAVLIVVVLAVAYLFLRLARLAYGPGDLLVVGAIWLALTVAFEFLFGHYVAGHPWSKLLADYNIFKGRVWVLVLFAIFLAPVITARAAGRRQSAPRYGGRDD
jgi:hypothetical protein